MTGFNRSPMIRKVFQEVRLGESARRFPKSVWETFCLTVKTAWASRHASSTTWKCLESFKTNVPGRKLVNRHDRGKKVKIKALKRRRQVMICWDPNRCRKSKLAPFCRPRNKGRKFTC